MQKKKQEVKHYELLGEKPMTVSNDGSTVSVGGKVFKRVVLPSVAAPKKTEEDLETALKEMDEPRTQETDD